MRYPNGKNFEGKRDQAKSRPGPKAKKVQFGQRGMRLENMLNQSNQWYLNRGLAVIHKKPTPIQVVKVDYPKRARAKITEAYYRQASTTDYNGIYKGWYVDFEAKQSDRLQSFPLNNIKDHQVKHMTACSQAGGLSFVIFWFSKRQEAYLYPIEALLEDWRAYQDSERSSIPFQRIEDYAYPIALKYQPYLDYLPLIDQYIADYGKSH
ncbi:Holliday junction resolvase RecU [Aerococcus sanguinicola]|uniref:Holliday junction resolvase RecU n=1 Tax=Aerococcus sanguinicola TaxID=119206 RepID=A0A120I900_9LACT|nr:MULTISPECIES: Holliday junction resolvase RecU [Aerococcus]AMB93368.1 Holliday junction resolvase RecU [Aerococcus sanguinicola]MDK7049749.1 Holliday junction resolvase RecU [Aerococcus sanguinicola]OFT92148.1 Holliday junction resolvase RecU [Aerococcus sp. HMSC23C02]PKZ23024.1 Holliday junction resolvase RecU [Aerococcus sanguinicola]